MQHLKNKKFWISLLLWVLSAGILGFHRWYNKKSVVSNILYTISLGGLGVWAGIDLKGIIKGDFLSN
jgi:TM2 domain-containing membrane protein YozV